jgi:hypothetical protein
MNFLMVPMMSVCEINSLSLQGRYFSTHGKFSAGFSIFSIFKINFNFNFRRTNFSKKIFVVEIIYPPKGGFTLATLGGNFGRRRDFQVRKLLGDATFGDRKIPNLSCVAQQLDGSKIMLAQ